jgi:dienelactone hydrolase
MLLAASPFFVGAGLSVSSGLGRLADVTLFVSLIWIGCRFGGWLLAGLLSLLPVRLPFRLIGNGIALHAAVTAILQRAEMNAAGAAALAGTALLAGYLAGSGIWLLVCGQGRRLAIIGYAGTGVASFLLFFAWMFGDAAYAVIASDRPETAEAGPPAADEADPSAFGPWRVQTFTYGSGLDPYRPEYAEEAVVRTRTVDGSALIDDWGWSRSWLWDADPSALPLNGRVWMPYGGPEEGPYPLVLIMHGNHQMADYSDDGYAYLGELLASRGYLTVSVDANFLNHSTWEGNLGDNGENITVRAWLLLQHLREIESLSQTAGNPFSGKADMERIALIGHSRGGQAAVLAAGFDDFFAGERHAGIRIGRNFGIDAVVALAPTDFPVDGRYVPAANVHYLLLQGSNDADVTSFSGDRQFGRISHDPGLDRFFVKASLYIGGANHGQFNEDWERRDVAYPTAWLLNGRALLSGEEQRQIAKVYVSAFLDTALRGTDRYLPMFRDYRHALDWLPDTLFISRYADSRFVPLVNFEEAARLSSGWSPVTVDVIGNGRWQEFELGNRYGEGRHNHVAQLEWTGDEATVTIGVPQGVLPGDILEAEAFGIALADLSPEEGELGVVVELETRDGEVFRTDLDDMVPVPGPVETCFLKPFPGDLLEEAVRNGELETSMEMVLQSYYLSFDGDGPAEEDPGAGPAGLPDPSWGSEEGGPAPEWGAMEDIGEIRITVEKEGGGTVLLDDIGLYLAE